MKLSPKIRKYTKSILATIGAVGVTVQAAITDDHISQPEAVTIGIAVVTAISVFWFKNQPPPDDQGVA